MHLGSTCRVPGAKGGELQEMKLEVETESKTRALETLVSVFQCLDFVIERMGSIQY